MGNIERTTTYGRKIIKGVHKEKSEYYKRLYISWGVCILIGLIIGFILCLGVKSLSKDESSESITETTNTTVIMRESTSELIIKPIAETVLKTSIESTPTLELAPEFTSKPKYKSMGTFMLTAYCSCEVCCNEYAKNRPIDENGKPIVYTANMSVAKQGVTVAADTNVLPFGTNLLIDGHEYTVQDRGGAIKGNRIDVYFESHQEARQFGVRYKEVFMKEGEQ